MPAPMLRAERIPVDSLRAHPRNPRKITAARLAALERVLAADPEMLEARPLIALPDGTVIAGNQRLASARSLRDGGDARFETVPTIHVDLEPDRATEWALRDNEGFGVRDDDLTRALLEELAAAGRALELTGLTEHDLQRLLGQPARTGADDVPAALKVGVSERGEVYKLGPHAVMCGDSTDPADVDRLLEGQAVDLVWTDPPYGVSLQIVSPEEARRRRRRTDGQGVENDDLTGEPLKALVRSALEEACRVARAGAPIYLAHPDSASVLFRGALEEAGWSLRQVLIWVKQQFVLGRQDYHWQHEPILYGWKPGAAHVWYGLHDQSTVIHEDRPKASELHPTTKPVGLVQRALVNSSVPGQIVYDPFGGSGSTLIAAEATGRRALVMELDPVYCDVIRRRFAEYTSQPGFSP